MFTLVGAMASEWAGKCEQLQLHNNSIVMPPISEGTTLEEKGLSHACHVCVQIMASEIHTSAKVALASTFLLS